MHRVFGGYFRNQLHCPACGYDSNTYDSYMDLSLEVDDRGLNSVPRALAHFAKPEVLDAQNRWKCPKCAAAVRARKQMTIRVVSGAAWERAEEGLG
jgi:ubiquitin carboxyl-terminal hydrolase 36/42